MSFIQRELDAIADELRKVGPNGANWEQLYIAQQALSWAIDPSCYKSPFKAITGTDAQVKSALSPELCPKIPHASNPTHV